MRIAVQTASIGFACLALVAGGCSHMQHLGAGGGQVAAQAAEIEPPVIHRDGRLLFSAQPDPQTLQALAQEGTSTVISFRRDSEMEALPFNEADVVEQAGMSYVHIPLGGGMDEEPGYDPEDVDRLAEVLEQTDGDVLMHCKSGTRARTIWTAYLIKHEGLSEAEAVLRAQAVGQKPSALDRLLGRVASKGE